MKNTIHTWKPLGWNCGDRSHSSFAHWIRSDNEQLHQYAVYFELMYRSRWRMFVKKRSFLRRSLGLISLPCGASTLIIVLRGILRMFRSCGKTIPEGILDPPDYSRDPLYPGLPRRTGRTRYSRIPLIRVFLIRESQIMESFSRRNSRLMNWFSRISRPETEERIFQCYFYSENFYIHSEIFYESVSESYRGFRNMGWSKRKN